MNTIGTHRLAAPKSIARLIKVAMACAVGLASAAEDPAGAPLVYSDLDAFAEAIDKIDAGSEVLPTLQRYMDEASPGMQIFASRFGTSAESIAEKLMSHPNYYHYVAGLGSSIKAGNAELQQAIGKLQADAPAGVRPVPIYFLVANMRAGGNPGLVQTPEGPRPAIAIAVELMSLSDEVDLAEFPKGAPGVQLADLPAVAVHEMSHIFQMQLQGMDNYRSLYTDPARSTNLAFAIREGCADFLVWRSTRMRFEDRYQYVAEHADQLWAEFSAVLDQPVDTSANWFGPRNADQPERPMQVGYGLGMQICQAFHDSASDKSEAIAQICGAYLPEHFQAILKPYAAHMERLGK
ncbi:hypothetical protein [Dokdonella sp.]|uniref:hypothetical protein n=1 Tax=Dokdonella sp. TaxID=2291710 RepID=UPI003527D77A